MNNPANEQHLNSDQLFANWLAGFVPTLGSRRILNIRRAEPRFQTRNFFARFKVETCELDGTGQNPTNLQRVVVEVSETNQASEVVTTECSS